MKRPRPFSKNQDGFFLASVISKCRGRVAKVDGCGGVEVVRWSWNGEVGWVYGGVEVGKKGDTVVYEQLYFPGRCIYNKGKLM